MTKFPINTVYSKLLSKVQTTLIQSLSIIFKISKVLSKILVMRTFYNLKLNYCQLKNMTTLKYRKITDK